MPDYDPKSIPILDDIVDGEKTDDAEQTELTTDDNLDLFNDDSTDTPAVSDEQASDRFATDGLATDELDTYILETAEPELGDIEELASDASDTDEHKIMESALIDYSAENDQTEEDASPGIDSANDDPARFTESQTVSENTSTEAVTQIPLQQQILLEPVVNRIVKQMMPDLEQQLRFLVKQALADELPDELIAQLNIKDVTKHNTET